MAPSNYEKTLTKQASPDQIHKAASARIQKIQSHLAVTPRGTRLKDKVCVITGVGSLKGIGFVHVYASQMWADWVCTDAQQRFSTLTKVGTSSTPAHSSLTPASGAKHLYLIDYDPTNLPDLKSTIEKTYPDVKVRRTISYGVVILVSLPSEGQHPAS